MSHAHPMIHLLTLLKGERFRLRDSVEYLVLYECPATEGESPHAFARDPLGNLLSVQDLVSLNGGSYAVRTVRAGEGVAVE